MIKKYIRVYMRLLRQDVISKMSLRRDFIISLIAMAISNLFEILFLRFVFLSVHEINGWDYYSLLFMYSFMKLSITPEICFCDNIWNLPQHIISGDFEKYKLRPLSIFFYYMSENFNVKGIVNLFVGISTLIIAGNGLEIVFDFSFCIKLILYLLSASILFIAIVNFMSVLVFFHASLAIVKMIFKLTDYIRYPIDIYHPIICLVLSTIIPLGYVSYYPSMLFLSQDRVTWLIWLMPIWCIIIFMLSVKLWDKIAIKYTYSGS